MKRIIPTPVPAPPVTSPLTIGAAIRASRTREKMLQVDAARMCEVSLQTYVDIEKGAAGVGIGLVLKVAREMGVRLFAFTGDDVDKMLDIVAQESWGE